MKTANKILGRLKFLKAFKDENNLKLTEQEDLAVSDVFSCFGRIPAGPAFLDLAHSISCISSLESLIVQSDRGTKSISVSLIELRSSSFEFISAFPKNASCHKGRKERISCAQVYRS